MLTLPKVILALTVVTALALVFLLFYAAARIFDWSVERCRAWLRRTDAPAAGLVAEVDEVTEIVRGGGSRGLVEAWGLDDLCAEWN